MNENDIDGMPDDLKAMYDMGRRHEREQVENYLIRMAAALKDRPMVELTGRDSAVAALEWAAERISEHKHLV